MPGVVAERLRIVQERIARAAERAGRDPAQIELVAVTKTLPPELVAEGVRAGLRRFGENRFQEAPEKIESIRQRFSELANKISWDFIGTLQSNKVRPVLEWFAMIQSIDRGKLVERADRLAGELGITARCLLQVHVSGSETQGGVEPDRLDELAEFASGRDHLRVEGLMAIGPLTDDENKLRRAFSTVRDSFHRLASRDLPGVEMRTLSMGMTGDFELAIEEGANLVRLGTAIFGPRRQ